MADRYLWSRQKLAIMEPFVSGDCSTTLTLALTLMLDLIRDTCAFALDTDHRAPSLMNIWRLLEAKDLHDALWRKAAQPYKSNTHFGEGFTEEDKARLESTWRAQDFEEKGQAFDEAYARVAKPRIWSRSSLDRGRRKEVILTD